jgi:hypothetical protein
MAAIQFPADPTNNEVWTNAGNGVTYTWKDTGGGNGYWSATIPESNLSAVYLEINGSNGPITGDLTTNANFTCNEGLRLVAPNGSTFEITVDDGGVILSNAVI